MSFIRIERFLFNVSLKLLSGRKNSHSKFDVRSGRDKVRTPSETP